MAPARKRADVLLVERGLFESRARAQAAIEAGLVTANGNYLTKHAAGVYSTAPVLGSWRRDAPSRLQSDLDRLPKARFTQTPHGAATIETYTVMHDRQGPAYAVVFGRLNATGERFHRQHAGRRRDAARSAAARGHRPRRHGVAPRRSQHLRAGLTRRGRALAYDGPIDRRTEPPCR